MHTKAVLTATLALVITGVAGAAPLRYAADKFGVERHLGAGDISGLVNDAKATEPPQRLLGNAAFLRAKGDLAGSSAAAADCEKQANAHGDLGSAMYCAILRAGNALIAGNIAGWATQIQAAKATYYPAARKALGADAVVPAFEEVNNYAPLTKILPSSIESPAKPGDLTVIDRFPGSALPFVIINIAGHPIQGVISTSASSTIIGEDEAKAAGLTATPDWLNGAVVQNTSVNKRGRVQTTVEIGGMRVRNMTLSVEKDAPYAVIGLDLLQKLGALRLTNGKLKILGSDSSERTACTYDLFVGSDMAGTAQHVMVPLKVGGKPQFAVLDTGSSDFFTFFRNETDPVPPNAKAVAMGSGSEAFERKVVQGKVNFELGGKDATAVVNEVYGEYRPYKLSIGAQSLRDHVYVIDFEHHHFCVDAVK